MTIKLICDGLGITLGEFFSCDEFDKLVKKGYGNKAIGDKIGLPGFIAGKYVAQASHFEKETLRQALEECVAAEEQIKTGKISDNMALEMIIIKYDFPKTKAPLWGA